MGEGFKFKYLRMFFTITPSYVNRLFSHTATSTIPSAANIAAIIISNIPSSTPHDISKLTMDIQFNVMGYPVAGGAFLKYSSEPYRTPMPAKAHQPVEVMANLEILNIIPRISANMEITFKNENGMQIAAGIVRVFFD